MKGSLFQRGFTLNPQVPCLRMQGSQPTATKHFAPAFPFSNPKRDLDSFTLVRPQTAGLPGAHQRSSVKGCVFPAASAQSGKCLQHDRQYQEPSLFRSHQPSMLLLDRAKFGVPDSESNDSRANDRRRLAKIREDFLDGAA